MKLKSKIFSRLLNNFIEIKNKGELAQNQRDEVNYNINLYGRLSIINHMGPKN